QDDAVIFDHLGDVFAARGQMDRARLYWEKSLKLNADQPAIREKIRALAGQPEKENHEAVLEKN
ncbi:MAG: hypothetical protein NC924_09875, partial [Candidatus Omnitrophica bacterium]|nr:hypothetical protein [Candidatus Omnitrophota bacterium]